MGKILEKALTPDSLNQAWRKLRRDHAEWLPGLSREEMEWNFVFHVMTLVEELRRGTYRPERIRQFTVAKPDGSNRIISAFYLRDKLAQRAVLHGLAPLGEAIFHPDSFGYRPGRNTDMACARANMYIRCGGHWLLDADIRKFFETIPHGQLTKLIGRRVPDRAVRRLVNGWLEAGSPRTGWLRARRGLPQGAVLSPFLCNIYLHELDRAITAANLPFVRFADDFLVFTPNREAAEKAREFVAKTLEAWGLQLHLEKTRVVPAGPEVVFLGKRLCRPPPPNQVPHRGVKHAG